MNADSANKVIKTLQRAGFRGKRLETAFRVVMAESGGNPRAHNPNRATGDDSYGLAQINMLGELGPARRKQFGLRSNQDLFDPDVNARAMFRMSGGGRDFTPWSAFKSGAYKRHTFPGAAPVGETPAPAATVPPVAPRRDPSGFAMALLGRNRDPVVERRDRWEDGSVSFPAANRVRPTTGRSLFESPLLAKLMAFHAEKGRRDMGVPADAGVDKLVPKGAGGVHAGKGVRLPERFESTHRTSNLGWPAIDIMGKPGTPVMSPVAGTVTRWGSAQGGEALYLDDDDPDRDPDFWLGHVDRRLPVGARVRRGQPLARISRDHPRPHAHWARRGR